MRGGWEAASYDRCSKYTIVVVVVVSSSTTYYYYYLLPTTTTTTTTTTTSSKSNYKLHSLLYLLTYLRVTYTHDTGLTHTRHGITQRQNTVENARQSKYMNIRPLYGPHGESDERGEREREQDTHILVR